MIRWLRQSLLVQLLGTYLLFVAVVLGVGLAVNIVIQGQLRSEVEAHDLALAQAIALDTDARLRNARESLTGLSEIATVRQGDTVALNSAFQAFKTARRDLDRVYWLDADGLMQISVPTDVRTVGTDFSEERFFQHAAAARGPVVEGGAVDLTTFNAVAIFATPIRDSDGKLLGVVATNLLLDDLSAPIRTIVEQQGAQGQPVLISMLDDRGQLVATPQRERLLQVVLDELPGADQALQGQTSSRLAPGPGSQEWLFTSVPVPSVGWAVIVQRPASIALAALNRFSYWLTVATLLFGLGGLLFWLLLLRRVIQPLHILSSAHGALPVLGARPPSSSFMPTRLAQLARRQDEVGNLTRSLQRLERDVRSQFAQLHTLLETSSAVVGTLDPRTVAQTIIQEVQRLVDVQAASVLVPDESGVLSVLASEGRGEQYDLLVRRHVDDPLSPSALALREGRPVQLIAGVDPYFPPVTYDDGFKSLLAIPIISPHAGGVVLVVSRTAPKPFSSGELELLLTFANYATLAWEHAVLYERSDERLREVALENERLYRATMQEKQTLTAVMSSMSDGLVLTDVDGDVLFANPGASAMIGLPGVELERSNITAIQARLRGMAQQPEAYDRLVAHAMREERKVWLLETGHEHERNAGVGHAIELHLFDVRGESDRPIGRGLLLRDITREHEEDQFKTSLLAAVGHELRTPLAAIKGNSSTLLQEDVEWPPEEQRHFLQTISDEADRLAQLVTNLLDLSRFEAGLLPLQRGSWQLEELVRHATQRVGRLIPNFTADLPADLPLLQVDRPRIEVVLTNLLTNAITYGENSVILRANQEHEGLVVVRISDNGPGIAADELPHLFERFYRTQRGVQRRSGGTGLGLAICKAFVEAHGGTIWVEGGTGGTTIAFTLPTATEVRITNYDLPASVRNS
ncbi:MAG: ATP-binding protein [Chloroflexia bacterium]